MDKVTFGVQNPETKEVINVATTMFGGILWLNELARIFANDVPLIIVEGKSDIKTFGDLRVLENKIGGWNFPTEKQKQRILANETEQCDLWNKSNCCTAPFWAETDRCSDCKENAVSSCVDCPDYDICMNLNKVVI